MNFYPRYPAHYLSKTVHLTMEQDGAYTRLLDWCYANEKPIPHAQRYAIARAQNRRERASVDAVLEQFFDKISTEFGNESAPESCSKVAWSNARVLQEMDKDSARRSAARINGRKGGRPKKKPPDENPTGFEEKPTGFLGSPPQSETQKAPQTQYPKEVGNSSTHTECEVSAGASDDGVCVRPEVQAALLLRARGLRTTPQNPELIDAIAEGVTPQAMDDMAAAYPDKPANYVIRAARRQHADAAKPRASPTGKAPPIAQTFAHKTYTGTPDDELPDFLRTGSH